jgi:hypothetical protein
MPSGLSINTTTGVITGTVAVGAASTTTTLQLLTQETHPP